MKKTVKISSILFILTLLTGIITSTIQLDWNQLMDDSGNQLITEYDIASTDAYHKITGDTELALMAYDGTHGGGGYGNATHPYIIENFSATLSSYNGHGILIQDTTKNFVLRNCYMHAPKLWYAGPDPYGGYVFLNVKNGRVENCWVDGSPIGAETHPTQFGFWVEECINMTFDDCEVHNYYGPTFSPIATGFDVYYCDNITIKNSNILGRYPIFLYYSLNSHVHDNYISGPAGATETEYTLLKGLTLYKSNYSIIESNHIDMKNNNHYVRGIDVFAYYNTIVNNVISNVGIGWYIRESVPAGLNSYIKLNSPQDDANYVGPEGPSAGYYPSSEHFILKPDGYYTASNWSYLWYPPQIQNSTMAMIANKTDAGGYDHRKVLELHTWEGLSYYYDSTSGAGMPLSGTYEFWFAKDDLGSGSVEFQFVNGWHYYDPCAFSIVLENDLFKFRDNLTLNSTGVPVVNNKWYRLSIDFCGDNSSYAGLAYQECQFRIHDSDGNRLLYRSPAIEFLNAGEIELFQAMIQTDGISNLTLFIDSPGFTWETISDSPGFTYEVGDNANQGLLYDIEFQSPGNGVEHYDAGYILDGEPQLFDSYGVEIHPIKAVIPRPDSEGVHSIQFYSNCSIIDWDGTRLPTAITTTDLHFFNLSYYNTYLDIINHTENDEEVPPGLSYLTYSEDLNVSLQYNTRLGTTPNTIDTWTNVSYFYKINDNPWNGPYNLSYAYGTQNVSFVISNATFDEFDHVYYYLSFEQYDNDGKYLDSYYWTRDSFDLGAFQYDEWSARENAFHKKVSPIPYDLSLNYSTFYYSQIESIIPTISGTNKTAYPMVGITNENITIDFHNITSGLTNYSVLCPNHQTDLNHTMDATSSNISRTVGPQFNYNQGIKSPFILPLSLPLSVGMNYTFPELCYDSIESDRNLIYTGGLLNLTYQGIEESWPFSWRSALKFSTTDNKHIICFDEFSRIMIYYESLNETIVNGTQKMVIALVENNADYPSNLVIDKRAEIVYEDMFIIPQTLLAIVYDPPGDHSYSQLKSGTTTTVGFRVETETEVEEIYDIGMKVLGFEISDYIQEELDAEDYNDVSVNGTIYDTVAEITFEKTLTSSINSDNVSLVGHGGGDLYYGSGLLVHYYVKQNFHYIVIGNESENSVSEARDPPNQNLDDKLVWNDSLFIDYALELESTFSVLGAYLDSYSHTIGNQTYNMSSLLADNYFLDNKISLYELNGVEKIPESPIFWTPDTYTEFQSSMTSTTTSVSYSITTKVPESKAFEFSNSAKAGVPGGSIGVIDWSGYSGVKTTITTTTLDTTATETNEKIICHLEDDDGMPLGLHDQFLMDIYKDKRFNTFGYIFYPNQTYTSSPYESGTRDRRPPTTSELFNVPSYLSGNVTLSCVAIDKETGVDRVKFYFDDDPVFDFDSQLIPTETLTDIFGTVFTPTEPNLYELSWDTSAFHGTYYLFVETIDDAYPLQNSKVSSAYEIQIDNLNPNICQARVYPPYTGAINLYADVFDADSGIAYVDYWDGDPINSSSTYLGMSNDASSSYNFVWTPDITQVDGEIHYVYARAYDKAGNYLDSSLVQIELDTDGDMLSDRFEINYGTDPLDSDTDNDTLSDSFELNYGTNPLNADTDGDGYSDGVEFASGTNPLDSNLYPGTIDIMSILIVIMLGILIGMVGIYVFYILKPWKKEKKPISQKMKKHKGITATEEPIEILKLRLARDEITDDEYLKKKKLLSS